MRFLVIYSFIPISNMGFLVQNNAQYIKPNQPVKSVEFFITLSKNLKPYTLFKCLNLEGQKSTKFS